jgi:hypothetical protein
LPFSSILEAYQGKLITKPNIEMEQRGGMNRDVVLHQRLATELENGFKLVKTDLYEIDDNLNLMFLLYIRTKLSQKPSNTRRSS